MICLAHQRHWGRFFLMGRLVLCLLGMLPLVCQADNIRVAVPSSGLAFSVGELSEAGEAARQRIVTDASASGMTGCMAYCEVLQHVWGALQPVFQAQQEKQDLRLLVLRSPSIEALSFADGTIVISEDFIARAGLDQAQIAFVLAHEASHVLLQHESQTLTSMLAVLPSKAARTAQDIYTEMEYNYYALSDPVTFIFHQIEFEADEVALQLAAMAGFAPQLQLQFMGQRAKVSAETGMYSTHPRARDRLQRLQDQMPLAVRMFELGQR